MLKQKIKEKNQVILNLKDKLNARISTNSSYRNKLPGGRSVLLTQERVTKEFVSDEDINDDFKQYQTFDSYDEEINHPQKLK